MGRDGLHGGTPPLSFSHLLPPTGELGWEIPAPVNQLHTVVAQGIEVDGAGPRFLLDIRNAARVRMP